MAGPSSKSKEKPRDPKQRSLDNYFRPSSSSSAPSSSSPVPVPKQARPVPPSPAKAAKLDHGAGPTPEKAPRGTPLSQSGSVVGMEDEQVERETDKDRTPTQKRTVEVSEVEREVEAPVEASARVDDDMDVVDQARVDEPTEMEMEVDAAADANVDQEEQLDPTPADAALPPSSSTLASSHAGNLPSAIAGAPLEEEAMEVDPAEHLPLPNGTTLAEESSPDPLSLSIAEQSELDAVHVEGGTTPTATSKGKGRAIELESLSPAAVELGAGDDEHDPLAISPLANSENDSDEQDEVISYLVPSSQESRSASSQPFNLSSATPTKPVASQSFYSPSPSKNQHQNQPNAEGEGSQGTILRRSSRATSLVSTPPRSLSRASSRLYARSPTGSPLTELDDSPQKKEVPKRRRQNIVIEIPKWRGSRMATLGKEKVDTTAGKRRMPPRFEEDDVDEEMDEDVASAEDEEEGEQQSDASKSDSGSGSDSESDSELKAILARAAARRATGATIAPPVSSSTLNANGSASGPVLTSPDVRRSSRAVLVTEKKATQASTSSAAKDLSVAWADLKASKAKQGLAALLKERTGKAGQTLSLAMEGRAILSSGFDFDYDQESTDVTREGSPRGGIKTDQDVEHMVQVAAEVAAEAPSPEKRAARQQAAQIATVLKEELKEKKAGVPVPPAKERVFWKVETRVGEVGFDEEEEGEGWRGCVARAIKDGLENPASFPSPLALFSPLRGIGSAEDHKVVAGWLLSLLCHPSTSDMLAERSARLLTRIITHSVKSASTPPTSPLLTAADFIAQVKLLGANEDFLAIPPPPSIADPSTTEEGALDTEEGINEAPENDEPMEVDPVQEHVEEGARTIERADREKVIARMMMVLQDLVSPSHRLLSTTDTTLLIFVLVRLAVDINAAPMRNGIDQTLQHLIESLEKDNAPHARHEIVRALSTTFNASKAALKIEIVRSLPHRTKGSKILRKWVAWVFLVGGLKPEIETTSFASPPPLDGLVSIVRNTGEGPLKISKEMDDMELYHNVSLLSVALTDLNDQLYSGTAHDYNLITDIFHGLTSVDGRIRTDIRSGNPQRNRAKNAVTRLTHSLTYQSRGDRSGEDQLFEGEDLPEENGGKKGGETKRRKPNDPMKGQMKLSFGAKPTTQAAATTTTAGEEVRVVSI